MEHPVHGEVFWPEHANETESHHNQTEDTAKGAEDMTGQHEDSFRFKVKDGTSDGSLGSPRRVQMC